MTAGPSLCETVSILSGAKLISDHQGISSLIGSGNTSCLQISLSALCLSNSPILPTAAFCSLWGPFEDCKKKNIYLLVNDYISPGNTDLLWNPCHGSLSTEPWQTCFLSIYLISFPWHCSVGTLNGVGIIEVTFPLALSWPAGSLQQFTVARKNSPVVTLLFVFIAAWAFSLFLLQARSESQVWSYCCNREPWDFMCFIGNNNSTYSCSQCIQTWFVYKHGLYTLSVWPVFLISA